MLDGLRMRCFRARFGFSSERCGFLLCTCTDLFRLCAGLRFNFRGLAARIV